MNSDVEPQDIEIDLPDMVKDPQVRDYYHPIVAHETASGAIHLQDGYDGVYLYPEQVAALRAYLNAQD